MRACLEQAKKGHDRGTEGLPGGDHFGAFGETGGDTFEHLGGFFNPTKLSLRIDSIYAIINT